MNILSSWPKIPYQSFKSTAYLLHMATQMLGKLKLYTPFEPHWANVILLLTSRGLTTDLIQYDQGTFSIDLDLIDHQVVINTSHSKIKRFSIISMPVAQFYKQLFSNLQELKINLTINPTPQEVASPIAFDQDQEERVYRSELANAWWRILLNSFHVMQIFHAKFHGETPPIGLMWGTFDLRDARYCGVPVSTEEFKSDYIRRNAMDEAQMEVGWWHGNETYQQPAYFSFVYPKPEKIEEQKILPEGAKWNKDLGEFILDYEIVRNSNDPEKTLLSFFESSYQAGAQCEKWDPKLVTKGKPI